MKSFSSLFALGLLAWVLLTLRLPALAQAPAWQSAQAVATATATAASNTSEVTATAVDAAGNVYLAGVFTNTVALGTTTLTSLGGKDVFVAKFSPVTGQFVWAQRAGGTDDDRINALAVSGSSVYVAGTFYGSTASFGATALANVGATNTSDVFVAKLTDAGSAGSFGWAQRAGGTGNDYASSLAVNGSSVYVAGSFSGSTASFGATALANAGATNTSDVFVAKLTDAGSAGSFGWAQRAGGTDYDVANALAVSGSSVYVAGHFYGLTVSFGTTTLTNANIYYNDVFVAKLTDAGSTGSFGWAQQAGGAYLDFATALAVSGSSVYVAGYFSSPTAIFGATTLTNVTTSFYFDVFVAKLTDAGTAGSFVWAQRAGGARNDHISALAVSGASVYVVGRFDSPTVSFGATTLTNVANTYDLYVAKLADAGSMANFGWAQRAVGVNSNAAQALAVSGSSVYVAGYFSGSTTSFGATTLTNANAVSTSTLGFLATLSDVTLTAAVPGRTPTSAALYPNPARHSTTLRRFASPAAGPLTLCDALGRPVRRYTAPASTETALDLHGLPAGLYLLHGAGPAQRLLVE